MFCWMELREGKMKPLKNPKNHFRPILRTSPIKVYDEGNMCSDYKTFLGRPGGKPGIGGNFSTGKRPGVKPGMNGTRPGGKPQMPEFTKPEVDMFKEFFAPVIEESEADDATKESFQYSHRKA